jgi:hypothetical protein
LRGDVIDFCQGDCTGQLVEGFYEVEGVYGNKYCWIDRRAVFTLERRNPSTRTLRLRGHAHPKMLEMGEQARIEIRANGQQVYSQPLTRPGLFLIEAPLPDAEKYTIELSASPCYQVPPDERWFTVNLSFMRLV